MPMYRGGVEIGAAFRAGQEVGVAFVAGQEVYSIQQGAHVFVATDQGVNIGYDSLNGSGSMTPQNTGVGNNYKITRFLWFTFVTFYNIYLEGSAPDNDNSWKTLTIKNPNESVFLSVTRSSDTYNYVSDAESTQWSFNGPALTAGTYTVEFT